MQNFLDRMGRRRGMREPASVSELKKKQGPQELMLESEMKNSLRSDNFISDSNISS